MNTGLQASQLSYTRNDRPLFSNLGFDLNPGQGLLICGPNGCGKTSLLKVLAGLISPNEGNLRWKGQELSQIRPNYHQSLHFLGHQHSIKNKLTVRENLLYSQNLADETPCLQAIEKALYSLGLHQQQNTLAQYLSAGQKRRLALTRLLASPKPLWILDEPFTNLDQDSQLWLCSLLDTHLQNQGMIILASHQALSLNTSSAVQTLTLPLAHTHSDRDPLHHV